MILWGLGTPGNHYWGLACFCLHYSFSHQSYGFQLQTTEKRCPSVFSGHRATCRAEQKCCGVNTPDHCMQLVNHDEWGVEEPIPQLPHSLTVKTEQILCWLPECSQVYSIFSYPQKIHLSLSFPLLCFPFFCPHSSPHPTFQGLLR